VKKEAQAVLLLLVGGMLIKITVSGAYVRYVKPGLFPLLLAGGTVLVAVAAATLWQVVAASRTTVSAHDARDRHHGHHDDSRAGWLLLVPTLVLLMFAPPALGSFQAGRNGTALSARADSTFAPLDDGDPVRLSVLDYASRAVFDDGRSLVGRRVVLSGFVIARPEGQPYLARLVVTCCAADARPIKVGLTGNVPTDVVSDQWIEVEGAYTDRVERDAINEDLIPYVTVSVLREVAAPDLEYES
jgi:uncharacterized repeat protein (TIGR03943 family)